MNTPASRARRTLSAFGGVEDLHALIDTVPDAMVVIDAVGSIMSFSRGAERMFGYVEAEVLGENVSILMPSPNRERHDGYLDAYLRTGEKRIIGIGRVTTARRRDGSTFPIDLAVGEVQLRNEHVFAGFIRDLTESRETERLLHNLQGELAHASRITSMGTLATSIAHELNQPLTAVTNYVQAARDLLANLSPENVELVREALAETATEALRAGQIVHRLRDFVSRGEAAREIASLQRMVTDTTALALLDVKVRNTNFVTHLDPSCDAVLVDPVQVQQVLLNLMRNALDAMANVPVKQLSITSAPDEDGMVRVSVSDCGPGISPEVAKRLFQPFVSTKDTGMGLGLSICHTIVTSLGGKIWAEPSEAGGTTFHFTLMSGRLGRIDMSEFPVYLIDDDDSVRRSVGFMLKTSGLQVQAFMSGAEFLKAVRTLSPGAILLDVRMPEIDGLEVQAELNERGVTFPVIVMTGHGDVEVAVRAMKGGALDFIEKPFDKGVVLESLAEAFAMLGQSDRRSGRRSEAQKRLNGLTPRERDVLDGLAVGYPNKTIGYDLGISARTVEIHRANLMKKLEVNNISDLLRIAFAAGLGED